MEAGGQYIGHSDVYDKVQTAFTNCIHTQNIVSLAHTVHVRARNMPWTYFYSTVEKIIEQQTD